MTLEELRLLVPQYLSNCLTPAEKEAVETQLRSNPEFRLEVEELRSLWDDLAAVPEQQPSPTLRARFYGRLNTLQRTKARISAGGFAWWKPGMQGLVRQTALALAVFVLGAYVGRQSGTNTSSAPQLARLDTEVQSLRQTVALSLMDKQSPTSRLEGISWSSRVERPDQDLVSALLSTLDHDPNINVRLAALDAVEKFSDEPPVRQALVAAIQKQDSPLVQIALIDAVVHLRDNAAASELRKLTASSDVNASVKKRAQWGLKQLSF